MADQINGSAPPEEDELVDYDEDQQEVTNQPKGTENVAKKGYVGIHSTGFKDFLLKPELLRAIVDCGFEHPSEGTVGGNALIKTSRRAGSFIDGLQVLIRYFKGCCTGLQCSTSAFRRLSWAWMFCARQSQGWEKQQCSCCQYCSSLNQSRTRLQR
jgi:hypothetical protein